MTSITSNPSFQSLQNVLTQGRDNQFVKLQGDAAVGSNVNFKLGQSTLMGKIKYAMLSDAPIQSQTGRGDRVSPRSEQNQAAMSAITGRFAAAATNTLKGDLETAFTSAGGNSNVADDAWRDIGSDLTEAVRALVAKRLGSPEQGQLSGIGRVTVGQIKAVAVEVDQLVDSLVDNFRDGNQTSDDAVKAAKSQLKALTQSLKSPPAQADAGTPPVMSRRMERIMHAETDKWNTKHPGAAT